MGAVGATMGQQVSAGLDKVSGHSLTALDNVRLLRDDLGIRIPRGMESAIARSQVLSSAIGGLGTGLVALGAAEIFVRLGMGAYELYEKFISLKAAAKEYEDQLGKLKEADFTNTRSIEDTAIRWNEAAQAAERYHAEAEKAGSVSAIVSNTQPRTALAGLLGPLGMGVSEVQNLMAAHDNEQLSGQSKTERDSLARTRLQQEHELTDQQIQTAHAGDASLQPQQKISAELAKQLALHKEDQSYLQKQNNLGSNRDAGSNSGEAKRTLEDQAARAEAAAQSIELQRQISEKTISLQDAARNAGLQGNALYAAQEQEAIAAVQRSATGSAAQVAAIREKFHNEEIVRLRAETDEVNKRARAEQEAGLGTLAKIQAQGQDRLSDIDQKQARGGYSDQDAKGVSADANKDRVTAQATTLRELTDAQKQYDEQVSALDQQATDRQVTGYLKIEAEAQKSLNKINDDWQKMYGGLNTQSDLYLQGVAKRADQEDAISAASQRQVSELHAKTMAEIQATEVQSDRINQTEDKAATGAIVDEYNKRLAAANAYRAQQLAGDKVGATERQMIEDEYTARMKADMDLASAQLEKQAQQTRDTLAGSLSSLFDDPKGFLEKRAKDLIYKSLANGILSATNNLQSSFGQGLSELLGIGPNLKAPTPKLPGAGDAAGLAGAGSPLNAAGSTLTQAGTTLTTSGTSLGTAGTNLSSSGTVLNGAGTALNSAAAALQSAAAALSAAQGGSGGGGLFGGGGVDDGGDGGGGDGSGGAGAEDSGFAGASSGAQALSGSSAASAIGAGAHSLGGLAALNLTSTSEGLAGSTSKALGSSTVGGKYAGAAGAAIAGGVGIYQAYQNSDALGGALAGGEAGAQIGGLFGPAGALIGAGIGAVAGVGAGLFGDNGKAKAEAYDSGTVAPALAAELANFNAGQTGYTQASRDLTNILNQAQSATAAMGSGARHYFTGSITPEVAAVQAKIDAEEKAGRSKITMSAAQFHSGGLITNFGDFGTSGTEGFIHAMMGERVMNAQASGTHGPLLDAMNAGYNPTSVLSGQTRAAVASIAGGSTTRMGTGGGGNSTPFTITALDSQSVQRWLRMGGGKQIQQHLNAAPGLYGGKSDE